MFGGTGNSGTKTEIKKSTCSSSYSSFSYQNDKGRQTTGRIRPSSLKKQTGNMDKHTRESVDNDRMASG